MGMVYVGNRHRIPHYKNLILGDGSTLSVTYLLRDQFTTDEAAPLTTPRTCEPGPGILTFTDTANKMSIAAGILRTSSATGVGDPRVYGGVQARAAGLGAWCGKMNFGAGAGVIWGWHTATNTYPQKGAFQKNGAALQLIPGGVVGAVASSVDYQTCIIMRENGGAFFFIKGGTYTEWTRIYTNKALVDANIYSGYAAVSGGFDIDNIQEIIFPEPLNTDYGIATEYMANAIANDTISHIADCGVEATWVAVTGETFELSIRRTDDNNRWIIRGSNPGSTLKLIEVNGGGETERASVAQTFSNGVSYRIEVEAFGDTIAVYNNDGARLINYTSASFNNTAIEAKVNKAVTDFASWPRVMSGTALTLLSLPL